MVTIFFPFVFSRFRSVDIWSIIRHGERVEYIELHYFLFTCYAVKRTTKKMSRKVAE